MDMKDNAANRADRGFARRFREVVDGYGSANALAAAIGRSEGALRNWLAGKSEPDVSDLRAICEATGTRVEWLVNGQGPRAAQAPGAETLLDAQGDVEGLTLVIESIEDALAVNGRQLPAAKKAQLIVVLYRIFYERRALDRETVIRLVTLAG
ncbi:MAG TPA: helix-turn-helix transcriptional regulator [Gammaproteobacteria bacterium]|nr:helix-turn-helix transcriptional regulator [Gammaproteobacteria bacterium]